MTWLWSNLPKIWDLTLTHTWMSAIPILVGFAASVPLGYAASRSRLVRSIVLVGGNIVYTLPALALIVLIPVLFGLPLLTPTNTVIALTLYAIVLMGRTAADGFAAVPDEVRQSASAVGFSSRQRFWAVELPLTGPVLLAGIRVVSVSTVSLATVGAIAGVQNLGELFIEGFQRAFYLEIFTGIVAVLILALVFDVLLSLIGRALMPWLRSNAVRRRPRVIAEATS